MESPRPRVQTTVVECRTCSMPTRVDFDETGVVEIFAVCPHVKMVEDLPEKFRSTK